MRSRDPLLYFLILGFALFLSWGFLSQPDDGTTTIVLDRDQLAQLEAGFEQVWKRTPSTQERDVLIREWVRDEIANREARSMGLAHNDPVLRRRLRQKFEAFMEQLSLVEDPGDEVLEAWFRPRADEYQLPDRFSLRQRFFSRDRRADPRADAAAALASLASKAGLPAALGDASALPSRLEQVNSLKLERIFGAVFAGELLTHPLQQWAGPVESAYGFHLVYLEERSPSKVPGFFEVRDAVLRDYREDRWAQQRESLYDELLDRYTVELPADASRS